MTALIVDFETTGLPRPKSARLIHQPKAIEFGAVLAQDGEVIEELSLLINPQEKLDPIITKITGVTDADLRGQPTFIEALPQIRALAERADSICSHNYTFDGAILRYELERNNITDFPWPKREVCTLELFSPEWGYNVSLKKLYEDKIGVPLKQTHRALDDVKAMIEIINATDTWRFIDG